MGSYDGQKTGEDTPGVVVGHYDAQATSTDVGHPHIAKVPPGYPSTAAAKAKDDSTSQYPTAGETRTVYPSSQ
jgi:hypothetical protein